MDSKDVAIFHLLTSIFYLFKNHLSRWPVKTVYLMCQKSQPCKKPMNTKIHEPFMFLLFGVLQLSIRNCNEHWARNED